MSVRHMLSYENSLLSDSRGQRGEKAKRICDSIFEEKEETTSGLSMQPPLSFCRRCTFCSGQSGAGGRDTDLFQSFAEWFLSGYEEGREKKRLDTEDYEYLGSYRKYVAGQRQSFYSFLGGIVRDLSKKAGNTCRALWSGLAE